MPTRKTAFLYTDDFLRYDLGPRHPLKQHRLKQVTRLLDAYGAFETIDLLAPVPATDDELGEVHTAEYLDVVRRVGRGEDVPDLHRYGLGIGDTPAFEGMYEASALYAGGSAEAARLVLSGKYQAVFNVAGGLHHAFAHKASGFCTFNDLAVAIEAFRKAGKKRIVYVDIDVHHGDGVECLYWNDPDVLTISLHESGHFLFPGTGRSTDIGGVGAEGSAVNVPFFLYTTDSIWHEAFDAVVPAVIARFAPDAFVLQFGADAHYADPLAHLQLTTQGWMLAAEKLFQLVGDKPMVVTGGGGYNIGTVTRLWTLLAGACAGLTFPDAVPAPLATEFQVAYLHDKARPDVDAAMLADAKAAALREVRTLHEVLSL